MPTANALIGRVVIGTFLDETELLDRLILEIESALSHGEPSSYK